MMRDVAHWLFICATFSAVAFLVGRETYQNQTYFVNCDVPAVAAGDVTFKVKPLRAHAESGRQLFAFSAYPEDVTQPVVSLDCEGRAE